MTSSHFGRRSDPIHGHAAHHDGLDIAAPAGTAIRAPQGGKVVRAGPAGNYGLMVELEHPNGVRTRYAHASEVLVKEGEIVEAGQDIAKVGSTGKSTGAHLHFEVRIGNRAVDPTTALKAYTR
jgi:murein DD-endopeptidase MepM/ murein hydrolase activator NlpD